MAYDATEVLASRNMILYYAPFADTNVFPLDTLDYGAAWGAPFVDVGLTDGGVTVDISVDRGTITVDQLIDPVLRPVTGREIRFTTSLAQMNVDKLNLASGLGTVATVAPGAGTKGHDTLVVDGDVNDLFFSIGFENQQQNEEPFRGVVWRGMPSGSPSSTFGTADSAATIALEITALPDTSVSPARIAEFRNVLPAI